ncbi:Rho family guanine nucleotide exchange factor CDC24 KNAG_0D05020 [Huiozyma naganishii CBS 8797]|uniref:DH domain-containing protein n=1 Tax=Huiozyma naganishii (strain ATCC MYA-139 / BCRC 22969 / CBS 8797 / KCTC 17520 / NBRC 10181 / NCYC 3082 / Yp74L-3) TaxID=1071383 RepID=J7S7C4_HUIN7|nr:hypothetical protein KNAG_0D05020 [Kazachstania naganishii CBS 8797]CCK70241.1 hypothetical protein KNAG_0D05020 [Kazachstania naganishii CBS 8797]
MRPGTLPSRKNTATSLGSMPLGSPGAVMNAAVTMHDSLYYRCLNVRRRLEKVAQLQPYLNLAYASSELLSEKQSLLLSQQQQQLQRQQQQQQQGETAQNHHHSVISTSSRQYRDSHNSLRDEYSFMDGITYTNSVSNPASSAGGSASGEVDTLLTFAMGILPLTVDCDPVTQLSQLFRQGSPLCVLFNAVRPQFKIPVVSSDDLKVCKKSIYDFILSVKKHLALRDEDLFTISDVFHNSTNNLMKVVDVVSTIMDLAPEMFPSRKQMEQEIELELQNSATRDDYGKVIKEFVITERKYVHDLETLNTYKTQLLENNIITSEELYMLFPNLTEAIDFQRRFLVSLEINALVDPSRQRIGALFMHCKSFFKLYEPWSIGQNAAIDFLTGTLEKIPDLNFVINNKLELQSFLYKPVQRLCRYPLLLKELSGARTNGDATSTKELDGALDVSRNIAKSINENQRRTENHQVVKQLYGRVNNWKGYRIAKFGELLYFDKVFISTSGSSEPEREFEVYLFEKIIILFSQVVAKKSSSLMLKKKNTAPSSSSLTLNLNSSATSSFHHSSPGNGLSLSHTNSLPSLSASGGITNEPKLDLRGRIMIMNLNQINAVGPRSLNITWESVKEQGNFLLKFKNEETRDNWSSCLQTLVRKMKSASYRSTASDNSFLSSSGPSTTSSTPTRTPTSASQPDNSHTSLNSFGNSAMKHLSDMLPKQRKRVSNLDSAPDLRSVSENYKHSIPESSIMMRISFNQAFYTILVELSAPMSSVTELVRKKLYPVGNFTKIKYQDEDGDYVMLSSDEDWLVAKDMLKENDERVLNILAY